MSIANLPEPILITRAEALHRLANALLHEPILAVDTEFEQPACVPGAGVFDPVLDARA